MPYRVISCKCMKCNLHFKIYTEFPKKWRSIFHGQMCYCPECGSHAIFLMSIVAKEGFICLECPEIDQQRLKDLL